MKITFLGAAGTVTGSKYLLEHEGARLLVDCGLFQGYKQLRLKNWASLPIDPRAIDAVLLTHAHLDHSGYIPLLVKNGFARTVHCTDATRELCGILLPDSGHLQEQDADFANRHHTSKHHPALPLYTQEDAEKSLHRLSSAAFHRPIHPVPGIEARFLRAGHILGAAMVEISFQGKTVLFSGDLGRPEDATMLPPEAVEGADYLVVESTYGDRVHSAEDPAAAIADAINRAAARGGSVIVPSFAVGRSQTLLVYLHRLKDERRIPDLPIFLDSPMAIDASDIFCRYPKDHKMSPQEARHAFAVARYVRSAEESKMLDAQPMPKVIISASGMATGGRILHHLKEYAPDRRNIVLFTGFQAGGTRGAAMLEGAKTIKIFGEYIPVEAEIRDLDMLSAHADSNETVAWLRNFRRPPRMTFITHGEPQASDVLRKKIEEELRWPCHVPEYRDEHELA